MPGLIWAERQLRRDLTGGFRISLHGADPGNDGRALLLGPTPVSPGALRVAAGEAVNGQRLEVGTPQRGGRATHVGLWLRDGTWLEGGLLERPITLTPGIAVGFPRGILRVRFGSG